MSKSAEGSYILLTDNLQTIKARLAGAPTDTGRGEKVPVMGGVANLLALVKLFEGKEARKKLEGQYAGNGIRYGELKERLAEAIYQELKPIQIRRKKFEEKPKLVAEILEEGKQYCSQIARQTLDQVRRAMGLV